MWNVMFSLELNLRARGGTFLNLEKLFDVFINHRGPDVKETLAHQLYESLQEMGIRVFLDSEEKELGNWFPSTIETAINSAAVHIAIFSKRYAESPWCLAELALMLQTQAKIIPVFYDVKPLELRHIEKGVYADAFAQYEKKFRYPDKLKEWKEALQSVSFITGHEFNSFSDCKNIVSAVQKEVQRTKSLHVAKYPVGLHKLVEDFQRRCLDERVDEFESKCWMNGGGKGNAVIVGIFGTGGVGKTTLSKELFNRKRSQYTRDCFLFDVREAFASSKMPFLQMKLIKDLFNEDPPQFQSIEDGRSYLRDCVRRSSSFSFLIVLDDIDHAEQLDALLITNMLNKSIDSLIIVTTRDVGVLINTGITNGYNLKAMGRDDSREPFCWNAFGEPHPATGYEDLVDDFLDVCGGLPLSLQVLGRHFHGRKQNSWSLQLQKVKKTLPRDIKQRLKISFDALDGDEKQVFMDIACFFINELKSTAIRVWEGSGWSAHHALQTLKEKCLVQETHVLRMHDHLRDLGREMAEEMNAPRRLWRPQYLKSLELQGFQTILAECKGRCFQTIIDTSMNAEITYFLDNSDDSGQTSASLLWLELHLNGQYTHTGIPSWIPFQNMQCLRILNGHFKRLWQNNEQAPSSLKELQIWETILEEFPDLSGLLNHLEILVLEFVIEGWAFLESLIINPRSLVVKHSTLSVKLVSNNTLMSLASSVLLSNFRSSGISLRGILHLNNRGQSPAVECPMSSLEKLEISDQNLVTKVLISGYHYTKLQFLLLVSMENLIEVDLKMVTTLNSLELSDCKNMKSVSGIGDLINLVELKLSGCSELEELPKLSHLSCLERVKIERCDKLNCLEFDGCKNLMLVDLDSMENLTGVDLNMVTALKTLQASDCKKLKSVSGIGDVINLVELKLSGCSELEELPVLFHLSCLERVKIERCDKLNCLEFDGCKNLMLVDLDRMENLTGVDLNMVTALKILQVSDCKKLKSVSGIGDLINLVELKLSGCSELELASLSHLRCLERVSFEMCEKLSRLELGSCIKMNSVNAFHLPKLVVFSIRLNSFDKIKIHGCGKLNCLELSKTLKLNWSSDVGRKELQIIDCPELEGLHCLACVS